MNFSKQENLQIQNLQIMRYHYIYVFYILDIYNKTLLHYGVLLQLLFFNIVMSYIHIHICKSNLCVTDI